MHAPSSGSDASPELSAESSEQTPSCAGPSGAGGPTRAEAGSRQGVSPARGHVPEPGHPMANGHVPLLEAEGSDGVLGVL